MHVKSCSNIKPSVLQEAIKEAEVELKGVQAEMAKIEDEEKNMQKGQIEIKHELEKYETVVKDNSLKIKHWKKEVKKNPKSCPTKVLLKRIFFILE